MFRNTISFIKNFILIYLLWVAFSIPVITAGASTVAAFNVAFKLINKKNPDIFKDFTKAFKDNFVQSTIVYLIDAALIFASYKIISFLINKEPDTVVIIACLFAVVMFYCSIIYSLSIIARYYTKTLACFENSILICTRHLFMTLLITAETAVFVTACFFRWINPIALILIFSIAYFTSKSFINMYIFHKQEELLQDKKQDLQS